MTLKTHSRSASDASVDFKDHTKLETEMSMSNEIDKLVDTLKNPEKKQDFSKEMDMFQDLFRRYIFQGDSKEIQWDKISVMSDKKFLNYDDLDLPVISTECKQVLNSLVVVKLNGGLGTTMGCAGPKSLIVVRNESNFLDLTIQFLEKVNNTYGVSVPLVLMNSYNTEEETEKFLRRYQKVNVIIRTFVQSRFPRVNKESLMPIPTCALPWEQCEEGWYPPGHGDLYRSLFKSDLLDEFLSLGKKWIFVSNMDNLGANVDLKILKMLYYSNYDYLMEVTDKTLSDIKGGTLIEYEDKLRLLEAAQVSKEHFDEFASVRKFKVFNTNNIWVRLESIKEKMTNNKITMDIIVNPKVMQNGTNVIQLEEAIGSAIQSFDNAIGLKVPRSRFYPVKTTSDLLLIMSNLYSLRGGLLTLNPARQFLTIPLVKLGTDFKKVKDFLERFASIPNILELDHLTVSGNVCFGKNVTLKGTVIIIANPGERIDIAPGSILENKIVSGNLRILDH